MENKLIEETKKEAENVLAQMIVCEKNSDKYIGLLRTYQDLMALIDIEQKRLNSIQELERKEDELAFNERKADFEHEIEEKKLKEQKKDHWWQVGLKVLGGAIVVVGNVFTVLTMTRINNSGETLTSFENKFINPERFK